MIVELGHFALVLALFAALAQATAPLIGAQRGWADFMRVGDSAATVQLVLVGLAYAALTVAFMTTDLSVKLVADHSHPDKPTLYKFAGVWGNHEGSMLLWSLILALFGALIAWLGRNLPLGLKARALAVQGALGVAFLAFILFTSNPFTRYEPALGFLGADLNPVLQDPGLAFHPPFLYLGYVGLSTAFAFAVAALMEGRVDAAWARWVRPWALAAWVFLTIGIALGSYWAYYELGWGGWWFWDPVENASFMPWLASAALLHSAAVVEKRGELKSWTILLAILGFSLALLGTFIVRSGVIDSVHSFASDPTRGVFILLILALSIGGALWLFAERAGKLASDGVFAPVSRETALLVNNLLLTVSIVAVFIGTAAPLFYQELLGRHISVGPPFFDLVFSAIMIPLILVLPVGAMLPWKRGDAGRALQKLWLAGVIALSVAAILWMAQTGGSLVGPIGAGLAVWLMLGVLWDLAERARFDRVLAKKATLAAFGGRLLRLPRSDWGKAFGHFGLGLLVLGATVVTAYEAEDPRSVTAGDRYSFAGYDFVFDGAEQIQGPNYIAVRGTVRVFDNGRQVDVMYPEVRQFPHRGMSTHEVALRAGLGGDLYMTLGFPPERRSDLGSRYLSEMLSFLRRAEAANVWTLKTYTKPFVGWIWIGSLVMAAGGLLSMSDRRHRVGAPAQKRRRSNAAAPSPTPAE